MVMNGFARLADAEIFSPGVILVRSRTERTDLRSSVSPEKALTEIGTLLRSSARRRAVTTISPAEAAIEDAASVAVGEAFGVSNRLSDADCAQIGGASVREIGGSYGDNMGGCGAIK